jgi:hypothetical protein
VEREIATVEKAKAITVEAGQGGASLKMPDILDEDFKAKLDALTKQDKKEDNALRALERELPFEIQVPLEFRSPRYARSTRKHQAAVGRA